MSKDNIMSSQNKENFDFSIITPVEKNISSTKENKSSIEEKTSSIEEKQDVQDTTEIKSMYYSTDTSIFIYPKMYHEEQRKHLINHRDISNTINLLQDFCITPPSDFLKICKSFSCYADLERWRRSYILSHL